MVSSHGSAGGKPARSITMRIELGCSGRSSAPRDRPAPAPARRSPPPAASADPAPRAAAAHRQARPGATASAKPTSRARIASSPSVSVSMAMKPQPAVSARKLRSAASVGDRDIGSEGHRGICCGRRRLRWQRQRGLAARRRSLHRGGRRRRSGIVQSQPGRRAAEALHAQPGGEHRLVVWPRMQLINRRRHRGVDAQRDQLA